MGDPQHLSLGSALSTGAADPSTNAATQRDRDMAEHAQGGLATMRSTGSVIKARLSSKIGSDRRTNQSGRVCDPMEQGSRESNRTWPDPQHQRTQSLQREQQGRAEEPRCAASSISGATGIRSEDSAACKAATRTTSLTPGSFSTDVPELLICLRFRYPTDKQIQPMNPHRITRGVG